MSRIELKIYRSGVNVANIQQLNEQDILRTIVNKWKFQDKMMGEQFITFSVTCEKPIDWAIGDFCVFRGETFTLNYVPSVTQKARTGERQDAYTYESVKFEAPHEELSRVLMLDITPTTGDYVAALGTNYTGSSKFQLFCGEVSANGGTLTAVCALAAKIQANLDRAYPGGWRIYVDITTTYVNSSGDTVLVTHTDDKVLSFDNTTVDKALAEVHNTFDLDYCVRGRNIYIGYNLKNLTSDNDDETFVFGYGKGYPTQENSGTALFQIKRIANSQQKIVTRLRALGSTKNMPYRYYNKKYDLSQALFPVNLQLPDTFETLSVKSVHNAQRDSQYGISELTGLPYVRHVLGDTNDAYIDKNDNAEDCPEGVREESARWDGSNSDLPEIYPTIEESTYGELRGALVPDQDGNTGAGSFPNYGDSERIDELLAVGYISDNVLVNDANEGDGILTEGGSTNSGTPMPATIGQTSVNYSNGGGQFVNRGIYYLGVERTLFTIKDVQPGSYAMVPTGPSYNSVIYGFNVSYYKDGVSAKVGYQLLVKKKPKDSDTLTIIGSYMSDFIQVSRADGITEMALPELPDVKNGENAQVEALTVTELCDIIVTFIPIIRDVVVPNGFNDNFALVYKVGMSRLNPENAYDPEYVWSSLDEGSSQEGSFHVIVKDMGFDITACFGSDKPVVAMRSGYCVGREFEIGENIEKVTYNGKKGYLITLNRATDSSLNTSFPSATDPIMAGDNFVLLGINMPEAFIKMAEVRLLRAASDFLADNCETKFTYQPYIDDIYLQRNLDKCRAAGHEEDSIFWRLYAGLKFTFRGIPSNEEDPLPLVDLTISQVSIQMGDNLTPKVEMTLNDDIQQTTLQKLTVSVDRIYNGSLFSSGSGGLGSGTYAAILMNLLQSDGGKLFLSKRHDDVAEGKITFNDVDTHKAMSKFKKGLKVGNFQSRLLGSGAIIDEDGNAEFESIYSRNFISTPEFRFNRVSVTEGEQWCTNGYGTILEVERIDDTTGYITLKLEENDYSSIAVGDICRGIYNDIASEYKTASLDDDSVLYEDEEDDENGIGAAREGEGFGFSCKTGFFTSYFWVKQMLVNKKGECKFLYELRNSNTPHPCEFMKFAQYGSFTNPQRRSSSYATSIGHYYEMVLDGISTWKINSPNVVYRKGWLGDLTIDDEVRGEVTLQGYGLYVQDNVYFGNAIVQLDPITLEDIEKRLAGYIVTFSDHVDVITVDDMGNAIGGLWVLENGYKNYRIHSAITVRRGNTILTEAASNADAGEGTYKLYAEGIGCTCKIEDSTLYITSIDNIKDGVAGSADDVEFDYDAMREMENCRVDVIVNCEGLGSIVKSFPLTIKHDSQPFVNADLTNEHSAVSWNTQTQTYIGLPVTFDMKMWHNSESLDIASENDISISPSIQGMTIVKNIIINNVGTRIARISITALPKNLSAVTDLNVTGVATYAGVQYERTLVHTISKLTDVNVYSLLPSVDEVLCDPNANNAVSETSVDCSVLCDSSDDKHFEVSYTDFATHNLVLCWKKYYNDGSVDTNDTVYSNIPVSVNAAVSKVKFILYGRLQNGNPDTTIVHDTEEVPVIVHGLNGVSGSTPIAKYKWFAQASGVTLTASEKSSTLDSWSDTAPNRPNDGWYLWMTQNTRHHDNTIGTWSDPVRISGDNGSAGEDSKEREWIYRKNSYAGYNNTTDNGTVGNVSTAYDNTIDKWIPKDWTDHPTGISAEGDTEYASWRDYDKEHECWGSFQVPIIWSHYGERGMDGDGVEYAFIRTKDRFAPEILNDSTYTDHNGNTYTSDEHLPRVVANNIVEMENSNNSSFPYECTDDPKGVNSTYKYEWVVKRSKAAAVNGVRQWEPYTGSETYHQMSLWAKFSDDGDTPINVYKWNQSADTAPSISGNAYPPSGWSINPPNRPGDGYHLWMSISIKHSDGSIDTWSAPIRISGESGSPGEDAADREWIYLRSTTASYGTAPASITKDKNGTQRNAEYIASHDDFVPQGWNDNPLGVNDDYKFEYAAYRDKARGATTWGAFSTPFLWSHYGERGMDGDGVEYVFVRTNTKTAPSISNSSDTYDGKTYLDDEYLPLTSVGRSTDDPVGVDESHKYEWVAKRTKAAPDSNGERAWNPYEEGSDMSLWATYSVSQPSYIKSLEAWNNDPNNPPSYSANNPSANGWSESTPPSNGNAYLWRRSSKMVLNESTRIYEEDASTVTYTRLNGTNGTSINPKGTAVTIANSASYLPRTTDYPANSLGLVKSLNNLYYFTSTQSAQPWKLLQKKDEQGNYITGEYYEVSDGDCYAITETCEFGGQDVKGHMFMWSDEAEEWIDLGMFKGESGKNCHIAWANVVTIANGQVTDVIGFSVGVGDSGDSGKSWMGVCVDDNPADPNAWEAYTWKYVKGEPGVDSSEREWIYKQSNSSSAPTIPTQTSSNKSTDGYIPSGWTNHPQGVTPTMPYEYACWRDKARGATTWGDFQGVSGYALLWSHYGRKGSDGDGMEYVFVRTKENVQPQVYNNDSGNDSHGTAPGADEHLPKVYVASSNEIKGNTNYDSSGYKTISGNHVAECTDDPVGTDSEWKFEWVLVRRKDDPDDTGARDWLPYSGSMSLWANWSKDGISQPSYTVSEEAWSNAAVTASPTTEPTPNSGWSSGTPVNNNNYAYLWRRSRLMILNEAGTSYVPSGNGEWTYVRLSGTNGTSITPKGNVIAVASSTSALPSSANTNDLAIVVSNSKLCKRSSYGWSFVTASSSDGDCYVVSEDCTYNGENVKGHMFMWSTEANNGNGQWIDLGQFKGDNGVTYYTHIAWARVVVFGTYSGSIPSGQTTTPNATSVTDFDISPHDSYNYMGVLVNQSSGTDTTEKLLYTWKYVRGENGTDAEDREWIYKLTDDDTIPSIPASSGIGTVNGVSTAYSNTQDDWVPQGWSDSPSGVDENHRFEYACWRVKERGETTWGTFQGVVVSGTPKAILWSHYGNTGTDGDGVEYVFIRTSVMEAPVVDYPSGSSYKDSSNTRSESDDDFLPRVKVSVSCDLNGNTSQYTSGGYHYAECTDTPQGVSTQWPYEWVLMRKKTEAVDGKREWNSYRNRAMVLWANFSESPYMLDLSNEQSFVNCDEYGNVLDQVYGYESTGIMIFCGSQRAIQEFNLVITPSGIRCKYNNYTYSSSFNIDGANAVLSNGMIILSPNTITENTASISIVATHKNNSNIVLSASYKVNKNYAGGVGINAVMYALVPSLNVIQKNADGSYRDTTMSVVVNKVDGTELTVLNTYERIYNEGLSLTYKGSHLEEQTVSNPASMSTSTLCGSASYTKLYLRNGNGTLLDSERINVVMDGESTPLYSIDANPDSIVIPTDEDSATYYGNITFKKREGNNSEVSKTWYSAIYVRTKSGSRRSTSYYGTVSGFSNVSIAVTSSDAAIEIFCTESSSGSSSITTNYVVKKEILVVKDGDTGPEGDSADFHKIVATGTNYDHYESGSHVQPKVLVDDVNILSSYTCTTGLTMIILNEDLTLYRPIKTYNVYYEAATGSSTTQTDALLSDIRSYAITGKIVIIVSYDAIYVHDRVWAKLGCEYGVGKDIVSHVKNNNYYHRSLSIICQKGMAYGTAVVDVVEGNKKSSVLASISNGAMIASLHDVPVVGDNLLQQTNFNALTAWSIHDGNVIDNDFSGCNAFECIYPSSGSYRDALQQVVSEINSGVLKNATWYTLSFYGNGGSIRTFIYPTCIDTNERYYIDGVEAAAFNSSESIRTRSDGDTLWTLGGEYSLHTFTFKTKAKYSSNQKFADSEKILWRKPSGSGTTHIAKPKLEEGLVATGWQTNETDRKGESADGIFVRDRGTWASGNTYIYKRLNGVMTRDVVRHKINNIEYFFLVKNQGTEVTAAPSSSSGDSNWESGSNVSSFLANTIVGPNANIGGFMLSAQQMRSTATDGSGNPMLVLNGNTGNAVLRGTIYANNFYQGVCLCGNSNSDTYSNGMIYVLNKGTANVNNGDYVKLAGNYSVYDGISNYLPCTYDATIVLVARESNNASDTSTVYLPDPSDFNGKLVEVYNYRAANVYVRCVKSGNLFSAGLYYSSANGFHASDNSNGYTLGAGSVEKFYSYNGIWYMITI